LQGISFPDSDLLKFLIHDNSPRRKPVIPHRKLPLLGSEIVVCEETPERNTKNAQLFLAFRRVGFCQCIDFASEWRGWY
jgi:hypothetical protein